MNNIAAFSQVVNNFNQVISTLRFQLNELRVDVHNIKAKLQPCFDSFDKIATDTSTFALQLENLQKSIDEQVVKMKTDINNKLLEVDMVLCKVQEEQGSKDDKLEDIPLTVDAVQSMIDNSLSMFVNSLSSVCNLHNNDEILCADNITIEIPSMMDNQQHNSNETIETNETIGTNVSDETNGSDEPLKLTETAIEEKTTELNENENITALPKSSIRGRGGRRGARGARK
jgi:hypothetical protein